MDRFVQVNGKNLRCGYTTGTCACGAAMFATKMLLARKMAVQTINDAGDDTANMLPIISAEGDTANMLPIIGFEGDTKNMLPIIGTDENGNTNMLPIIKAGESDITNDVVVVDTPAGIPVKLDIHNINMGLDFVSCSVIKDGGDDPDVTSGMHIYAKAELIKGKKDGVIIEGGEGVGVVTKPGLDQPVGNAAINSTPRKYITEIVETVKKQFGCSDTIKITISAPEGVEIAKKTFNPRMGIEGGISIIGTTGIVEPMSNDAIVQTTKLEINQRKAKGEKVLYIAPGRIGENFAKDAFDIDSDNIVLCSNNIGEAFDSAVLAGFEEIVFIGHIGKLVKLGYGARNTHSANNDGRIEELILCALKAGADKEILNEISDCVTTDGAIAILEEAGLLDKTMSVLGDRIESTLNRWVEGKAHIKLCVFTNINNEPRVLIKRGF